MTALDRTFVVARDTEVPAEQRRIDASTAERALAALGEVHDTASTPLASVCAVLDDGMDRDEFVALVSVLVVHGVTMFDTNHPQIVQRVLDTHSAIAAGQIEVLGQ